MITRFRAVAKFLWVVALFSTGLLWLAKRKAKRAGRVIVLTFHRVLDDDEFERSSSLPGIRVRTKTFEAFAAWASRNFDVLSSGKLRPGETSQRVRMLITFDDGWEDTYTRAYPVVARHGIPFTVFVCSGLAGQAGPFWPERVCRVLRASGRGGQEQERTVEELKRLPEADRRARLEGLAAAAAAAEETDNLDRLMTWNQIRHLHRCGIEIGSHTVNHAILTGLPSDEAFDEMAQSRRQIERTLNAPCRAIAYPNGNVTSEVRDMAAGTGYSQAFTTQPGLWDRNTDPLQIPRINIWEGKLTGPSGRFSRAMTDYCMFWLASG